ncbi:protein CBFA2T1 isoform X2 [Cephus cinctus]|uniref:Protein CBFA2T1 isoform X2 n=1 Tax=Cephus cinctus TaxID=211228 RepID=A0AAJ7RMT8_CEPCN|nr:protein CBFA2T1 isoform X2 [Cephus cinctus]XP_024943841.1 protein CBFA2T1 isoform X2 [Cephus cinctus]XP_024943842.1 protein CBFA2T1 isoform X2 [Cephus cinctus]XP_024943843.1 protein CBFA2T1 isoform X2 [Cephus cinctus]
MIFMYRGTTYTSGLCRNGFVGLSLHVLSLVCSSREKSRDEDSTRDCRLSPSSQRSLLQTTNGSSRVDNKGSSRSSDSESPVPSSQSHLKSEKEDSRLDDSQQIEATGSGLSNGNGRGVSGVFGGHGKLKRLLGTLVQFATDISPDTGDTVRSLVLGLLSGTMTAEEFHSALQDATNFPLRGFVLPYLKHTLPSLQRDLNGAARANNQTCAQYLRSNESTVLEAVGLASSSGDEIFTEQPGTAGTGSSTSTHYAGRTGTNSSSGSIQINTNPGSLHHYTGTANAPKRRASDTPYYENGGGPLFDDGPVYGKRSTNPWSHHHHQQQQSDSYCWYNPLHSSGGSSIQNHHHSHSHGPSPIPPSLVQINQLTSCGPPHVPQTQLGHMQNPNGPSLDDEWKNIHVMLNCILGMVEKTKRALAILQRRGCTSPAAAPTIAASGVTAQNGSSGSGPTTTNGSQMDTTGNDRDGSLKRLSGEIVAQTIRATEDRVAEVKRRAEEAVQEVKRAAVAEVQRAVAVAVAESRATERLRVHRLLDLPLSQRNHGLRQGPFLRVPGHATANEQSSRTNNIPSATTLSANPSSVDDDKETHLTSIMGSSCWNCGRPALETCGGCGVARYCSSFCQHRDWEAGGHHATCNNPLPRDPPRSSSRSPSSCTVPTSATGSGNDNESEPAPSAVNTIVKGK